MDDEINFDLTKKKKKKSKKITFDTEEPDTETVEKPLKEPTESQENAKVEDTIESFDADGDFSNLKKKKKKKKPFDMSDLDSAMPQKEEQTDNSSMQPDADEELNFELPARKRKPGRKVMDFLNEDDVKDAASAGESTTWKDTDRDYTYQELLERVFDIMREKNPDVEFGERKRFVMKPPQVSRAGAKKTAFANFSEICKMLHRQPKHLLAFLLAELGTSGSVDGSNSLIIKGRFHQKQIETVLRRYIKEYVTCHTCKSPETILQHDKRLFFLQCEACGARCSVASIKSGFQAVTGKRAAMRAKTT